jgi:hypothetical protein
MGNRIRNAIIKYQRDNDLAVTGVISDYLYDHLSNARASGRAGGGASKKNSGMVGSVKGSGSCQDALFSQSTIKYVSDLFACDRGKAIFKMSSWQRIKFTPHGIDFREGKIVARMWEDPAKKREAIAGMQRQFSWDKWFTATQSSTFYIYCVFPASAAERLNSKNEMVVSAKLESLDGSNVVLSCR